MSLPAVTPVFEAASLLLAGAGVAKAVRPADTARALKRAGLRGSSVGRERLVRTGAVAEVLIGAAAVLFPSGVTGMLVAATYAGFAAFIGMALLRGWPISSCGCFGKPDTPPTPVHLVLNALAAGAALVWAAGPPASVAKLFDGQPWAGVPLVAVTAVVAGLAYVLFTNPVPGVRRS